MACLRRQSYADDPLCMETENGDLDMEEVPNSLGLPVFTVSDEEFRNKLRLAKSFGVDISSTYDDVAMEAYFFGGQVVINDIRKVSR